LPDQLTYNEIELLSHIAQGDERAFTVIFQHYYAILKPFVRKYTDSRIEADEIIQQTFIRVWLNRDKLPEIQNFHAWIFKIVSREYLLFLRGKMQVQKGIDQLSQHQRNVPEAEMPQDNFQLSEMRHHISEAVNLLPEQRRRIYQMSRDEGLKIFEIADELSLSPNTVKNALTTALKQIREYLAAKGHLISLIYLMGITICA
jgi:RNA polymerase sigma-70 factor (family 1)